MTMTVSPVSDHPRLILVYNADSGLITALMHAVHKQVQPSTYPCSLCAITYGAVSMKREWKRFLTGLMHEVVIHHRDDFTAAFPGLGAGGAREVALPAILISDSGEEPRVMIDASELDAMADADALMQTLRERIAVAHRESGPVASAI